MPKLVETTVASGKPSRSVACFSVALRSQAVTQTGPFSFGARRSRWSAKKGLPTISRSAPSVPGPTRQLWISTSCLKWPSPDSDEQPLPGNPTRTDGKRWWQNLCMPFRRWLVSYRAAALRSRIGMAKLALPAARIATRSSSGAMAGCMCRDLSATCGRAGNSPSLTSTFDSRRRAQG